MGEDGAPHVPSFHIGKTSYPYKLSKMDGGASSSDAFRLPSPAQELIHPIGNGLVLRYGYTMNLVAYMASFLGMTTDFPPSMEAPFELLYFVATDSLGTPMTALRAVLKDGLTVPGRPPKALVIDKLQTSEVYQKQGLATSLINFVKDIAIAHGIGLYASCELNTKAFWELRGFEEVTHFHLNVCENDGDLAVQTVLLRSGELFSEYLPETEFQISSVRNFFHSSSLLRNTATEVSLICRENCPKAFSSTGSAKGKASAEAGAVGGTRGNISNPCDNAGEGHQCSANSVHVSPASSAAAAPAATLNSVDVPLALWVDTSQTPCEEEARCFLAAADAGASLLDEEAGAGGGQEPCFSSSVSTSSTIATVEVMNAGPTEDTLIGQPGSAAMAAVTAVSGNNRVESGGWNSEPAVENVALVSYSREILAPVGETIGSGIPTIDEQEEAQIQLAIMLSLSKADDSMGSARRSGDGAGNAGGVKRIADEAFPLALWMNDTCGNEDHGKSSGKRKEVSSPGGVECLDRRTRRRTNEDWTSTPQGESWSGCADVGSNATTLDWERWRAGDGLSPRRRVLSMGTRVNTSLDGTIYNQIGPVNYDNFDFGVGIGGMEAQGGAEDEIDGLEGILAAVSWEKDDDDAELMQGMEASRQEATYSPLDAVEANELLANLNKR